MATHHVLLALITALIVVVVAAIVGVGLYFTSHCTFDYSPSSPGNQSLSSPQCTQRRYTPSQLDHRAIDSCVCVCSEQLGCDKPTPLGDVPPSALVYYVSSRDGDRLKRYDTGFSTAVVESDSSGYTQLTVTVNGNRRYQQVLGFGGAFTDAAGVNINAMSEPVKDMIMRAYFGEEGGSFLNLLDPIFKTPSHPAFQKHPPPPQVPTTPSAECPSPAPTSPPVSTPTTTPPTIST